MTLKQAFFILRHGSAEGNHKYLEAVKVIEEEYKHQAEELALAKKALIALTEEKMQLKREVEKRDYALDSIIWYNGHGEWLTNLADQLEATDFYASPLDLSEWHTEMHCIWMLLVGMFGDWGTSIRGGWIEKTKECAEYIRKLCKDDDVLTEELRKKE